MPACLLGCWVGRKEKGRARNRNHKKNTSSQPPQLNSTHFVRELYFFSSSRSCCSLELSIQQLSFISQTPTPTTNIISSSSSIISNLNYLFSFRLDSARNPITRPRFPLTSSSSVQVGRVRSTDPSTRMMDGWRPRSPRVCCN